MPSYGVVTFRHRRIQCSKTGKVAFTDRVIAEDRLATLRAQGRTQLTRAYRCPSCKLWHLTSKQNRKKTVRQREKFNDGVIQACRVSKHEDGAEFRRSMESAWATALGLEKP
jgi:hypothetical protein